MGNNYEVGLKGELMGGRVNTSIALFRIDQKNRAQQDLSSLCTVGDICYLSSGKVRSQGVDAEISGEVAPGWQLFAGYTFNTLKFLDATEVSSTNFGRTVTPKHILRLWSDYRAAGRVVRVDAGRRGELPDRQLYGNAVGAGCRRAPYAVWNARIGYDINKHWSAALNVNNVFDKTYYQTIGAPGWGSFYGDPRNATLTLRGRFLRPERSGIAARAAWRRCDPRRARPRSGDGPPQPVFGQPHERAGPDGQQLVVEVVAGVVDQARARAVARFAVVAVAVADEAVAARHRFQHEGEILGRHDGRLRQHLLPARDLGQHVAHERRLGLVVDRRRIVPREDEIALRAEHAGHMLRDLSHAALDQVQGFAGVGAHRAAQFAGVREWR